LISSGKPPVDLETDDDEKRFALRIRDEQIRLLDIFNDVEAT
jgi:hypothetical protein